MTSEKALRRSRRADLGPNGTSSPSPSRLDAPIVLDAVAASACPVKTRRAYESVTAPRWADPGPSTWRRIDPVSARASDPVIDQRERERTAFVADVLDRWLADLPGSVDLRDVDDVAAREAQTLEAMRAGRLLIVGPALPVDVSGHRSGSPHALLRSEAPGLPRYAPVLVRWHKILRRSRAGDSADDVVEDRPLRAALADPHAAAEASTDQAFRLQTRLADFLQLAHHHRLLQSVGRADEPWGAVIGTDDLPAEPRLTWVRLDRPAVRIVDRDAPAGWRSVSLLEQAQTELRHRLAIAGAIRAGGSRPSDVVEPVVVDECRSCAWWTACRAELDPDDLSLRLARGRLDRVEITALRALGVVTVADLARSDLEDLLPAYLPAVAHRRDADVRLRTIARRARMLAAGEPIERETSGPIEVPAADVEIDLDIETSAAGRIYLWGFAVDSGRGVRYVGFSRFGELDEIGEEALAREALGWLRAQVEGGPSVLVYHYSGYEVAMIEALAARRPDDDLLGWAAAYARTAFVDLLQIVQVHFFGASGLGLKQIAVKAGFGWRDPQPGGLNSQRWFDEAVHGSDEPTRTAARRRVLAYNEDDVRATAQLRAWLRAL